MKRSSGHATHNSHGSGADVGGDKGSSKHRASRASRPTKTSQEKEGEPAAGQKEQEQFAETSNSNYQTSKQRPARTAGGQNRQSHDSSHLRDSSMPDQEEFSAS